MVPVKVQKISYYHPNRSYAVILKELAGDRRLPVLIGAYEAQSIAMAMEYIEASRPLTHDLIVNIVKGINSKLSAVKITRLDEGVFYSKDAIYADFRPGDIRHSQADISKAIKFLGYNPKYDVTSGLNKSIKWYIQNV